MGRIRRSRLSHEDYSDIWDYIARDNPGAADALLQSVDAKLVLYVEHPEMGTKRDDILPGLRTFPVGSYIVFYRIVADGIQLARVMHGMRKITAMDFRGSERE